MGLLLDLRLAIQVGLLLDLRLADAGAEAAEAAATSAEALVRLYRLAEAAAVGRHVCYNFLAFAACMCPGRRSVLGRSMEAGEMRISP